MWGPLKPAEANRDRMLFLEDDRRELWPGVARTLQSMESLDMVLFLHAGDGPEQFVAPFLSPTIDEYLESVTPDADGREADHSRRVSVDEALLAWLEPRVADFEDWGDSLAVYRPGKYDLVAAVVPHEGIIVVADEFGSALAASGLLLSDDRPDWWQRG